VAFVSALNGSLERARRTSSLANATGATTSSSSLPSAMAPKRPKYSLRPSGETGMGRSGKSRREELKGKKSATPGPPRVSASSRGCEAAVCPEQGEDAPLRRPAEGECGGQQRRHRREQQGVEEAAGPERVERVHVEEQGEEIEIRQAGTHHSHGGDGGEVRGARRAVRGAGRAAGVDQLELGGLALPDEGVGQVDPRGAEAPACTRTSAWRPLAATLSWPSACTA
jgi:hypothetical protein